MNAKPEQLFDRVAVSGCRLACFSGTGFSDSLQERAGLDQDVLLVGLSDLYGE
ncbi:hypothetical protein [Nocardia grenadensis]|uniref:hypothetical protein n=1 Tax=Nocardia grenadensis TaxID=931537 RepID=UPI000AC0F8F2|nr:hypothetical protein [Nocardia grenadensis]